MVLSLLSVCQFQREVCLFSHFELESYFSMADLHMHSPVCACTEDAEFKIITVSATLFYIFTPGPIQSDLCREFHGHSQVPRCRKAMQCSAEGDRFELPSMLLSKLKQPCWGSISIWFFSQQATQRSPEPFQFRKTVLGEGLLTLSYRMDFYYLEKIVSVTVSVALSQHNYEKSDRAY